MCGWYETKTADFQIWRDSSYLNQISRSLRPQNYKNFTILLLNMQNWSHMLYYDGALKTSIIGIAAIRHDWPYIKSFISFATWLWMERFDEIFICSNELRVQMYILKMKNH